MSEFPFLIIIYGYFRFCIYHHLCNDHFFNLDEYRTVGAVRKYMYVNTSRK
jgi:hypothetical protein